MAHLESLTKKRLFTGTVVSNSPLGPTFYRITFQLDPDGAKAFATATPGQFAELDLSRCSLPTEVADPNICADRQIILRRPFSFSDIRIAGADDVQIDILYCVLGPATTRMTTLRNGDQVTIIGPLGKGFTIPANKKTALLIAGGMGAPPMQHLGSFLSQNHPDIRLAAFAGARSKDDLPFTLASDDDGSVSLAEFSKCDVHSHIATDDGSVGLHGFVTDCAQAWIRDNTPNPEETIIYTCGPEPMLKSVAALAFHYNIDCQVSMERMMACGIGLCQSCAVEAKVEGNDETVYKLCCKDGPVFDSRQVIFE